MALNNFVKITVNIFLKISFGNPETIVDTEKKFKGEDGYGPTLKYVHPKGLKERCKQTSNLEEALGVLLVASNVERRVRSRARLASTLDEALDFLFVGGESGDEGNGEDINFNDLEDEQLFCDSEADETH